MSTILARQVLKVTPEEENAIRESFGRSANDIESDVIALKNWLLKQPHLPKDIDQVILQRMLQFNKFSLERTKSKLDMFYTIRSWWPEYNENRNPLSKEIQIAFDTYIFVPLPKLCNDLGRVYFFRLKHPNLDMFNVKGFTKFGGNVIELCLSYDLCVHEHLVFDYTHYTIGHIAKITPTYIKQMYFIVDKAYSDRIKSMNFINVPTGAMAVINLIKSLLKEKIANRIHVHKNYESLHKIIPIDILPSDYGGNEKPLIEIERDWRQFYESQNDYFIKSIKMTSIEKLRIGKLSFDESFGIEGSFRQLTID